jgi:RimJ/RimL family protein N-acetyltransferase
MPKADLSRWTARPRPSGDALEGRWCRLERLNPERHAESLYEASTAPGAEERHRFLFERPPATRAEFGAWMGRASAGEDPLFYAVIDRETGRCEGRQALMRIAPEHGVIEVGSILWGPRIARTRVATEALYLIGRHVFRDLGYRRFEWKCDALNAPSRRAALRFGFQFEGVFRQHMVVKARNRDTAWYAIIDSDWPALEAAMHRWLAAENFDASRLQRRSLAEMIAGA